MQAKKKKFAEQEEEELREYMEQRAEEMARLEQELEELKERHVSAPTVECSRVNAQEERRLERQEEMERMMEMQRQQEEQRKVRLKCNKSTYNCLCRRTKKSARLSRRRRSARRRLTAKGNNR